MPDKPQQEDSRRMWERVLSSIPHGVKVRTISVRGGGEKTPEAVLDSMEPPAEQPTPGPSGLE
jgi:hypothetical protein